MWIEGEDIEVTKLLEPLEVDLKSGRNLITRRLSRGVVADCFAKSEAKSTYAIVGNPGIGKSWTLIYALQQALLYENVCVFFASKKLEPRLCAFARTTRYLHGETTSNYGKTIVTATFFVIPTYC